MHGSSVKRQVVRVLDVDDGHLAELSREVEGKEAVVVEQNAAVDIGDPVVAVVDTNAGEMNAGTVDHDVARDVVIEVKVRQRKCTVFDPHIGVEPGIGKRPADVGPAGRVSAHLR
jgi:hypothetical protein